MDVQLLDKMQCVLVYYTSLQAWKMRNYSVINMLYCVSIDDTIVEDEQSFMKGSWIWSLAATI